jgi:hypothetical protein
MLVLRGIAELYFSPVKFLGSGISHLFILKYLALFLIGPGSSGVWWNVYRCWY